MGLREWLVLLPLIFIPSVAAEVTKWFLRKTQPTARSLASAQ
jgi:hypothetical protein